MTGSLGAGSLDAEQVRVQRLAAAVHFHLHGGAVLVEPGLDHVGVARRGVGALDDGDDLAAGFDQAVEQAMFDKSVGSVKTLIEAAKGLNSNFA